MEAKKTIERLDNKPSALVLFLWRHSCEVRRTSVWMKRGEKYDWSLNIWLLERQTATAFSYTQSMNQRLFIPRRAADQLQN